jgi:hypothetical protein
LGKKQAAVAAAANAASKKLQQQSLPVTASAATKAGKTGAVDALRREADRSYLDEVEYHDMVIEHMHHMEDETTACVDLMDAQPELRWYMRPYLVDFIVEIHQTFRLRPETLFLTMNIVDRYVSKRIVYKRHYQLVGCAALLIAAKFEDAKDKVPLVSELAQMCCSAYDESAFVQMEGHVLSTIGWVLGFPTPEAWLRLACATTISGNEGQINDPVFDGIHASSINQKTLSIARFLLESSLFVRDFIGLSSSGLTAGCILLARIIEAGGQGRQALSAVASSKAIQAAQVVDTYLMAHGHELSEILVKKYSFSHYAQASTCVVDWYDVQRKVSSSVREQWPVNTITTSTSVIMTAPSMTKSSSASSFSTPRRSAEDVQDEEEEDVDDDSMSMHSRSTTSSVVSTPSQMSTDGEDEDDDDDLTGEHTYDEEDSDMPVTPLSLNSLHDPLVATEAKENSIQGTNTIAEATKASVATNQHLQPRDDRRALSLSRQDNLVQHA